MSRLFGIDVDSRFSSRMDISGSPSSRVLMSEHGGFSRSEGTDVADDLRGLWQFRRAQIDSFPEGAINYPAWDIILLCYLAQGEDRPLCVKQIECQLTETHASVLRRITAMEKAGILARCRDDGDWRRTLVLLTKGGIARMQTFLALMKSGRGEPHTSRSAAKPLLDRAL